MMQYGFSMNTTLTILWVIAYICDTIYTQVDTKLRNLHFNYSYSTRKWQNISTNPSTKNNLIIVV